MILKDTVRFDRAIAISKSQWKLLDWDLVDGDSKSLSAGWFCHRGREKELVGKSSRRACSKFSAPLVRKRWITCGTSRDSALLPENYVSKKRKAGQEILSRN